jgi:thymidine phosphorylase
VLKTDGSQPVGRGIGPALEAQDVLAVLQNRPDGPADLKTKALELVGVLLEMAGMTKDGFETAGSALADGRAWRKFQAICEAQGGMRVPPQSSYRRPIEAKYGGRVLSIDNRRIARVAKLAGAPVVKCAGIEMHCRLGDLVQPGQPLYTVHAEARGEMDYAMGYVDANADIISIDKS